jgi:N-glycosylase/DNA lyase
MTTSTADTSLRAGALILAVADQNYKKIRTLLTEAAEQPAGLITLIVSIASVSIECAALVAGEDWREVMLAAMQGVEVDDAMRHVDEDEGKGDE